MAGMGQRCATVPYRGDRVAAHRGSQRGWPDRFSSDSATVAAGFTVRRCGAARTARLRLRGLPLLWHASGTARYLLHWGFVMLGEGAYQVFKIEALI
jgi:hypothetical protein